MLPGDRSVPITMRSIKILTFLQRPKFKPINFDTWRGIITMIAVSTVKYRGGWPSLVAASQGGNNLL